MEKKLTKKEKGITLVALIITIIILLILAVISIRAITGDNILGKSEKAKEKYESAKSNELDILKDYENSIEPENLDVEKILNKAYIAEKNNVIMIYSIIDTNEGKKLKVRGVANAEGVNVDDVLTQGDYPIELSSNFNPIVVPNGEKITNKNFLKIISESLGSTEGNEEGFYISVNNIYPYGIDTDGIFWVRNSEYDTVINNM